MITHRPWRGSGCGPPLGIAPRCVSPYENGSRFAIKQKCLRTTGFSGSEVAVEEFNDHVVTIARFGHIGIIKESVK